MSSPKRIRTGKGPAGFPAEEGRRARIFFFMVSLFVHLLLFGTMIFFPGFQNKPKLSPPVIEIDLVSFSQEPYVDDKDPGEPKVKETESQGEIPQKAEPVVRKEEKVRNLAPDISLKAKPKNLKELMKKKEKKKEKREKREKKKKKPEKKIVRKEFEKKKDKKKFEAEKKEKSEQKRIASALSRLKEKVREQGMEKKESSAQNRPGSGGGGGNRPIDLYHLVIASTIEQNWVFNEILAKLDQDLEVRILIKILKSGEIRDIIYETKSGNPYLDESAKRAIKKANPLPQLPPGLKSYDVGLIFTPKGLK